MKFLIVILLFLMSCAQTVKREEGKKLNNIFVSYWEARSKIFPFESTENGDNRYNHLLVNDQTSGFRRKLIAFYKNYQKKLKVIDRTKLKADDQISYDIFKYELGMQIEKRTSLEWMFPFQQMWGTPLTVGKLGTGESFQPFKTMKDYSNWLKRIYSFNAWTDSAISNFREGIKRGVVLPKVLVVKMIPQMQNLVSEDPTKSIFYGPVKKIPENFSEKNKQRIKRAYIHAIKTRINPAYKKLVSFLSNEYLPKARETHGIYAINGGEKYYQTLVKYWTTTTISPASIFKTGLREVQRLRREMEKVKNQVGFKGPLKDFFSFLDNSEKLTPFKNPNEIITAFGRVHDKIKPKLPSLFGMRPKTPFEIRKTESFRSRSASPEYSPGSADGSRPGIFYIPILDATKFNIATGMESLFLHEAIPGHHYQISFQQENIDLPAFRRFSSYGSCVEGWALYTESLGKELGLYTNPYQYMGALSNEMLRAVRLVVDVGIHAQGWTREKAIQYMMENFSISYFDATAEVERYIALPGQALSYKVGSLKIWELRRRYQKKLGEKFILSDFHDEILKGGCMPLSVLEIKLNRWSASF